MHPSILTVGRNDFFGRLPFQICHGIDFTVETAVDVNEAQTWIEVRPPDILMVQAGLEQSLELCRWLKQQAPLSWIYCILVEDRPQLIAERKRANWNWELDATAIALEEAADAYIWLPDDDSNLENKQLQSITRLLLAHIQVGLRKVKKYRDLIQTNDVLSTIAYIDSLTELNNRRALESHLVRQIRTSRNHEIPLSVLMLDVDYFKVVNDTYGHLVGDRILKLLSSRLRYNLRSGDIPFRYGGEEFVILLHNTNCQDASVVARRLQRIVSEQPFFIDNTLSIPVTISIGTGCLRASDDSEGVQLLARADEYLLQAKAAGRNCTINCTD
ncbi:GGDEF domain-containing protein [Gloeocapsopsis dulcis]|uniref:GGDEF domain-containing protein n=1 Tax=Gloeocapsopsis dulcis AAB1 = 1H9 TaxID=1433147 RepID=A0A6N8G1W2_9CHRO|nr:GGDEF domain-containing protein [Gloeocapsopsis dulcis]MUL38882.1 GGDEF domain-containing protein [Gloeocapsopsis dulcis AAB1 = 1H9]WNN89316.1 GGDEF domain-containing protein [Gloeocapsopsis dulcis]